jgi:hypothetical protein
MCRLVFTTITILITLVTIFLSKSVDREHYEAVMLKENKK